MNHVDKIVPGLTKRLKASFSAAEIKNFASIIADLQGKGLKVDDAFPYGIPANVDALQIRGNLTPDEIGKLSEIIGAAGSVREIKVFPRGIIAPESLRVHIVTARG